MPGLPEEPLGPKIITLQASLAARFGTQCYSDAALSKTFPVCLRGVPKGSRDHNLERHSRGRGLSIKATRTLWRLPSDITTAMPSTDPAKFLEKLKSGLYGSA